MREKSFCFSKSFFPTLKEKSFCLAKAFFLWQKDFSFRVGKKFLLKLKILWFGEKSNKIFSWGKVQKHLGYFSKKLNICWKYSKLFQSIKAWWNLRKSQTNKKKHSVSIIVLATLFGRNLSSSDFSSSLSYLSRKKGTSETFLSLSLFISRPRPQKSGFGFEKPFLSSLFSTSVTWKN